MDLNTLWFFLIAILFLGFFILEGFDFGVGILLPLLSREDHECRMIINTIGPHWDANEVWLITAGGAMFAAFPNWYATLFSGFYLPLFLMLLALIVRGVAFEFRSKDKRSQWRRLWDWMLFSGSLIPGILLGVAFANLLRGVPIDAEMNYVGGFWNLLNPFALLCGLTTLALFILQGALFLSLKLEEDLSAQAQSLARQIWLITLGVGLLTTLLGFFLLGRSSRHGMIALILELAFLACLFSIGLLLRRSRRGWSFIASSAAIALGTIAYFIALFPQVMVSSLNPEWSLNIYNASSSDYTLRTMSIVAFIFVPVMLIYQGWSYWVFRRRITRQSTLEY